MGRSKMWNGIYGVAIYNKSMGLNLEPALLESACLLIAINIPSKLNYVYRTQPLWV